MIRRSFLKTLGLGGMVSWTGRTRLQASGATSGQAPPTPLEVKVGSLDLNELEMVRGEIYANIWQSDEIVMIAPADGRVVGRVDLRGLLSREDRARPVDVLNGIAYDAEGDRLFVTGKLWPRLFEIRLRGPGPGAGRRVPKIARSA